MLHLVQLSICPVTVPMCHLPNMPTHHRSDVPFDWQRPAAATAGSEQ